MTHQHILPEASSIYADGAHEMQSAYSTAARPALSKSSDQALASSVLQTCCMPCHRLCPVACLADLAESELRQANCFVPAVLHPHRLADTSVAGILSVYFVSELQPECGL